MPVIGIPEPGPADPPPPSPGGTGAAVSADDELLLLGSGAFWDAFTPAVVNPAPVYATAKPVVLGPQRLGTDRSYQLGPLLNPPYDPDSTLAAVIWPAEGRYSVPANATWKAPDGSKTGTFILSVPRSATSPLSAGSHNLAVSLIAADGNILDEMDGKIRFTEPVPKPYSGSGILTVAGTEWVIVNRRRGWLTTVMGFMGINATSHYGNNLFIQMAIGAALDVMRISRTDLYGVTDADLARVPVKSRLIFEDLVDFHVINQLYGNWAQVNSTDQNFTVNSDQLRKAMDLERQRLYRIVRWVGSSNSMYEVGQPRFESGSIAPVLMGIPLMGSRHDRRFRQAPPVLDWPWLRVSRFGLGVA